MDRSRRRFVPSSEGLEGRQLLSTTAASAPANAAAVSTVNPYATTAAGVQVDGSAPAAQTIEAKFRRVQNLPFFLGVLNNGNAVPQPTVQNIQNDVGQFVAQLHPANSSDVSTFNLDIRKTQPYLKISPASAQALNNSFGAVLDSAGADPAVVADLQSQMNTLTQYSTTQNDSRINATEAYATVLETALGVGRPLVAPANAPNLLGTDHTGNKGKVQITHNHQPSLTGNYIAGTNIQIVDAQTGKNVLGSAAVDPTTGVYTVQFSGKLPDGIYKVRVRAEDSGYLSPTSPALTFEVVTPTKK